MAKTLLAGDTCADLGYAEAIDDFPLDVGTFSRDGVRVTVSNLSSTFDRSATSGRADNRGGRMW